jgi:3-oxoacyl-[acyl-carrier protein] reductase
MDLQLQGKRALVTAASSGIGKGCAAALAREAADVFICARDEDRLKSAAQEVGAKGYCVADVSNAQDLERLVSATVAALGGLDVLVINVGDPSSGSFLDHTDSAWMSAHEGTLLPVVRLVRSALPHLKESSAPTIINITSTSPREVIPGLMMSGIYRSAVEAFARYLAIELAPDGVTVNNVAPGSIFTALWDQESADESAKSIPLGRLGAPSEIGAMCAFLSSASARYITGQTFTVDGGASRGARG